MRGVDISADGTYMVVVTTGSRARPLCDAVARFELGGTGRNILPSWVDYSGGDTFTGVAVTRGAALDWSDVRGLAVASGGLYSAHGDGRLHRLELP